MNNTDADMSWLEPINKKVKEFNINGCNSANPDVYNIVYGFMQKVEDYGVMTGWDGGTAWSAEAKNHVRGGGDYTTELPWYAFGDSGYYVKKFQSTWLTYVPKTQSGAPARNRIGQRMFY